MFYRILNFAFVLGLISICLLLFLSSLKVTYSNIKFYNIIKRGKIIEVEYVKAYASHLKGTYKNTIIEDTSKNIFYGANKKMFEEGDTVKFRYSGEKEGNVIFEVNNKVVGSKYDLWDMFSPFIVLLFSYVFFRFIKYKILK